MRECQILTIRQKRESEKMVCIDTSLSEVLQGFAYRGITRPEAALLKSIQFISGGLQHFTQYTRQVVICHV